MRDLGPLLLNFIWCYNFFDFYNITVVRLCQSPGPSLKKWVFPTFWSLKQVGSPVALRQNLTTLRPPCWQGRGQVLQVIVSTQSSKSQGMCLKPSWTFEGSPSTTKISLSDLSWCHMEQKNCPAKPSLNIWLMKSSGGIMKWWLF